MNPVKEVRGLISCGLNSITISLTLLPKGWMLPVDLELISSGYVMAARDESKRIYKKLIQKENTQ